MSYKNVCLTCQIAFNNANRTIAMPCPTCGKDMIWMTHRFRPPRKRDKEGWATVRFLLENGFNYDHFYQPYGDTPGAYILVSYPTSLREAREFVEKYKSNTGV